MEWPWFTITPWIQTVQIDAGDGKFEIVVLVRMILFPLMAGRLRASCSLPQTARLLQPTPRLRDEMPSPLTT